MVCIGIGLGLFRPALAEKGVDDEIRVVMHDAFDALVFLIEAAIEPGAAPRSEADVEAALANLEAASGELQKHGRLKPGSFNLLGRSLEENIDRMIESYRVGMTDVSDLYLLDTVEHCVTCHSLLPEDRRRNIGSRFAEVVQESQVEPGLAARLLVAVRQVPLALDTWEAYLGGDGFDPGDLVARAEVEDYLWQVLHLTRDPRRPQQVLATIRDARGAPFHLRRKAELWRGQLSDLAGEFDGQASIGEIRELFAGGFLYSDILAGRDHLVRDALVSSQAHTLLADATILQAEERAELYFMLAMVHLRSRLLIGAVPTAELYLEAAIREAPDSEIARSAYAELQEYALQYFGEAEPTTELFPVPMTELRRLAGVPQT